MKLCYLIALVMAVVASLMRGAHCSSPKKGPFGPGRSNPNAIEYMAGDPASSEAMGICHPDGYFEAGTATLYIHDELNKLSAMVETLSSKLDHPDPTAYPRPRSILDRSNSQDDTIGPQLLSLLERLVKAQEKASQSGKPTWIFELIVLAINFVIALLSFLKNRIVKSGWLQWIAIPLAWKDADKDIKDLQDRVRDLEVNIIANIRQDLSNVVSQANAIDSRVNNLNNTVTGLDNTVRGFGDIRKDLNNVVSQATAIDNTVTGFGDIRQDLNNVVSQATAIDNRVNNLNNTVQGLGTMRQNLNNVTKQAATTVTTVRGLNKRVQGLDDRATTLDQGLEDKGAEFEALQNELKGLKAELELHKDESGLTAHQGLST